MNLTVDGTLLLSTFDTNLPSGSAGVYAGSAAFFDNLAFSVTTPVCTQMTDGDSCTFVCAPGLVPSGPITRTCSGTTGNPNLVPDPVQFPMYCTLPPVTFLQSTLFVLENSPANTLVGNPLVAYSTSPAYQVLFDIVTSAIPCAPVSGSAAENGQITLTAPAGCAFSGIAFASFGTPSQANPSPATPFSLSACHSPASAAAVAAACLASATQSSCTLVATTAIYSDPCSGIGKLLAVTLTTAIVPGVTDPTLFSINACTGQVALRTGGRGPHSAFPDFEGVNRFNLLVRAYVAGYSPGSDTYRTIPVAVLNLDEPPIVQLTTLLLPENAAALTSGALVLWGANNTAGQAAGLVSERDMENSTVVFSLAADSSLGRFSINATSGQVLFGSANKTGSQAFSFEALPNSFTLSVTATQRNDSTMFATNAVKISILDVNDPPLIARGQVLSALSELATVGASARLSSGTMAAREEAAAMVAVEFERAAGETR
jgi:hypothetical protein